MAECSPDKRVVEGSNPLGSTTFMKRRNFLHALIGVPVVVSLDSKTLLEAKEAEQDLVNSYSAVADVHRIRAAVMSEDPSRLSAEDRLLRKMYKPDWDAVERCAPRVPCSIQG